MSNILEFPNASVADATAAFRERAKAILNAPEARQVAGLANFLALNDIENLTAEQAIESMRCAIKDIENSAEPRGSRTNYIDRKTEAGTLGLAVPETPDSTSSEGWKRAVDNVNARLGDAAR